jgi:hypothetical protein
MFMYKVMKLDEGMALFEWQLVYSTRDHSVYMKETEFMKFTTSMENYGVN